MTDRERDFLMQKQDGEIPPTMGWAEWKLASGGVTWLRDPALRFALTPGLCHLCTLNELGYWLRDGAFVPRMQCGQRLRPVAASTVLFGEPLCAGCALRVNFGW